MSFCLVCLMIPGMTALVKKDWLGGGGIIIHQTVKEGGDLCNTCNPTLRIFLKLKKTSSGDILKKSSISVYIGHSEVVALVRK